MLQPSEKSAPPQLAIPCGRGCLEELVESFLAAMAANDASRLPLAEAARYTELGQAMGFDDGLWRTASDVGAYRHVFADPASGQAGFFATLKENGRPLVMGGRLRLDIGRLAEAEVVVYRSGTGPAWNDAGVDALEEMERPKALWGEVPAGVERKSRQELAQIANCYFDAIENNDGKGYYPFTDDCDRLENGVYTTNNPGLVMMGGVDIGGMGCKAQFSTGLYGIVTRVHHRRFEVIDEEQQAVFALAVFDHGGHIKSLTMPSGKVVDVGFFSRPSSILLAEAFKIQGDLIRQVEAVGTGVPYHLDPGWR
ncbi:MAG: hypothetical protein ACM3YM_09375 [Sphingomonadales bacterium]